MDDEVFLKSGAVILFAIPSRRDLARIGTSSTFVLLSIPAGNHVGVHQFGCFARLLSALISKARELLHVGCNSELLDNLLLC